MPISNSYPSGIPIADADLFVGTKAYNNRTVNYTAQGVADYLNINSKVAIGGQMSFQFTIVPNIPKTIAFEGGLGNNTAFSAITKLIVSAMDLSTANITIFLNYLNNSQVLLSEQNQPNFFGHYKITGYTQIGTSAFYELDLEFIGGNGTIIDKQYYDLVSFVLSAESTIPTLQEVTDEGNTTTNPIIFEDSVGLLTEIGTMDGGSGFYFNLLNVGNNFKQFLANADNTDERIANFPDKNGTIAFLDDITIPTLQQVTDAGNETDNSIISKDGDYKGILTPFGVKIENADFFDSNFLDNRGMVRQSNLGYQEFIFDNVTINGLITIPNASGTLALLSDIPPLSTVYQNEIHVSKDGSDVTGNGTLLNPFATITQGLTLVAGTRKTIVLHPGSYSESPSITVQYTVLTTFELLGGNTEIVGTVSTNKGCTISGVKMNNLTITAPTGTGNVNILNCEISGTLTKSSNADYTVIRLCDYGAANITGGGLVAIFGGNPNFTTINNASANVIIKSSVTVAPVLTAGTLSLADSIVVAAVTNAFTSAAGTFTTLLNSQFLTSALNNVAPVVLNGFYSILNCVFDKPNSTLVALSGTGGATNSIVYSQFINADKFIKQGGTSSQYLMADGSVTTGGGVTSVTATSPITSSGGATPVISTSMATNKLIGRSTAGTGVMEEITIGTGLTLSGGILNGSATGVTSVGLTMPSAFTVTNSPITSSGDIAVTGAGTVNQYVRGDGTLANFPNSTGGGSSINYYLNGSVSQGTFGGDTYYQMSKTPILGAGTNFIRTNGAGNGYIASFITNAGDPSFLNIPGGNWNLEFYFQSSATGGSPQFYGEIYKVSATNVFTLVASGSTNPEGITNGTTIDQYFTSISVPQTSLLITDRLAIRIYVITSGRTITLHTENGNLCEVLTTFTTGLTALNGLTDQVQFFNVGTGATNFNISSSGDTHTFNLLFNIRRNANNSSNNNINYNGYAVTGSAESSAVWTITRLTIAASGSITVATATNVAWTNRESATYI